MKLKSTLDPHQVKGTNFIINRNQALLQYWTGSGKSLTIILSAFWFLKNNITKKILIVCTKSAVLSFKDDFKDNTDYTPFIIKDIKDLNKFFNTEELQIGVVKYNIYTSMQKTVPDNILKTIDVILDPEYLKLFKKHKPVVFFDEFHTLKNPKSSVTTYWKEIIKVLDRYYGLTATAYTRSLYDLYYLTKLLNKNLLGTKALFTQNYINMRDRTLFLGTSKRILSEIASYKNLSHLADILKQIRLVYKPDLKINTLEHRVDLLDTEIYTQTAKGVITGKIDLNEEDETKPTSFNGRLVELQRTVDRDQNKLDALVSLVKSLKSSGVVIYFDYLESVKVATEHLKAHISDIEILTIDGSTSIEKRAEIKDSFKSDPSNKIVPITKAGGQSLNLQATNHIIFYNCPYDVGSYYQIQGRIVRQYSKHAVYNVHLILANNTIDMYKYLRLKASLNTVDQTLGIELQDCSDYQSFNSYMFDNLRNSLVWNPKFVKQPKQNL